MTYTPGHSPQTLHRHSIASTASSRAASVAAMTQGTGPAVSRLNARVERSRQTFTRLGRRGGRKATASIWAPVICLGSFAIYERTMHARGEQPRKVVNALRRFTHAKGAGPFLAQPPPGG